jgi:two-component system NtrC family sensor kinase
VKVASKIILVACLAFLPILAVHTWLSLEREETLFRSDMERDLSLLATHLRGVAAAEWRRSGAEGVSAVIAASARADRRVRLDWRPASRGERGLEEGDRALTWVEPVVVDGKTVGELTLTESLAPMYAYLHSTVAHLGLLTLLLISGGLLAARLLSRRLIGQRLDRLVRLAEETGAGRLGQRVDVGGHDEITRLGASLGAMSEALAQARRNAERLNAERMTMLEHLRHADRLASIGRVAGSLAHELGTPLNVVLGHANRISEGTQTPSETKDSAATIHRHVKRMETTIRDILGFVRQTPGEGERIDLNAVVESVCTLLRPLAHRRAVKLEVGETPASAFVRGREVSLEQVLSNLVSNAIDASPEGGRVSLTVASEERIPKAGGKARPVVVVRVQDQGPGVAEDEIARLFDAFYTSKAAGQGTGLGLWLAEGIIRDHGGSIEVENLSEGGACFAMVLPASGVD